jgi:hypothetical protein
MSETRSAIHKTPLRGRRTRDIVTERFGNSVQQSGHSKIGAGARRNALSLKENESFDM